ncbi:rho guanine nucleotide exchange factor 12 isoform X2 [Conger conger]|uniref:rho guanine nucleotide exchange factor 12 isoform X2 n=1 Tax=Conger conger TaxID=82655 RepID=UPI002A5B01A0|nr:rho guanine nucleotide exchange factor 12 isoform X2 [Conger conger]
MSGIQATVSDRPSSLLTTDPPDKKLLSHDFDPTGLVQRCVIIQKDENGFGLTVSGDNPVFVQLVKEDGAAMRAGVQTGDRIIKVNGTLVTHSNHVEVVKLIKSGSYVALTVLGRPPGVAHIPLAGGDGEGGSFLASPNSPGQPAEERFTSPRPAWEDNSAVYSQKVDILQKMLFKEQRDLQLTKEEYSRNPSPKLLKEIQEANKRIPQLQSQLSKAMGGGQVSHGLSDTQRDSAQSPKTVPRDSLNCHSPDAGDTPKLNSSASPHLGSPTPRHVPQIIAAEDEYFDGEQEQVNGQYSCFQNMELLKVRPAHLAVFLHHVVSQFDPAPLLCYLYAELCKQTSSKDTRRIFTDLNTFFMDRAANLKVAVPESISSDLERRKPEVIPEELLRQYVQLMQDVLLPDIQKHLEDFRQKRSMGLTLADVELNRLDAEQGRDRAALDRERSCAEQIVSKIEDVLLTSSPSEEEKCTTMQFVILTYMKHLGVKVKEPRSLEHKRVRINFLPKIMGIQKGVKTEKEGEEKVKKPRFPNILGGPPRRTSRMDSAPAAMETGKQRPPKQLSQPALSTPEPPEAARIRGSQSSEGSDLPFTPALTTSPTHSITASLSSDGAARDPDTGLTPSSFFPKLSEGSSSGDTQDSAAHTPSTLFDFSPCSLDQLPEDERESDRAVEGGTPRSLRRTDGTCPAEQQSEDDQERDSEQDPPNWQQLVGREVLASLTPHEIKRQEVINELFYTERAHLRMLKVMDSVFYQKMTRDAILPPVDIKRIFTNLEEIVQLHGSIAEQMTTIRKKSETVIGPIGEDLLSWFSGGEEEKIKRAVGTFCSNQPFALEIIKSRQKKDARFSSSMQEAESNPVCRRLQLKDMIPVEMQRLTKYPLLLENIAKYTDDAEEKEKVKRAGECCKKILNYVNQAVKEAENKQRLEDYQRRLDLSSLKQNEHPMIAELKSLDLTKKKMVHEGPLSWKVNKDKTIELYTLLLEDILVLLQKQDERLILKCHSKNLPGTADTRHIYSPIIRLSTVLVRSVATDNKSFFVISMSDNGAQIYELMAQTVSEQRTWHSQITQRADYMKSKEHNDILLPQPDGEREAMEIMNSAVPRLNKDPDRNSTGSVQSPERDGSTSSPRLKQAPPPGSNPFEEEEDSEEGQAAFLNSELADRLPFLKRGSRQGLAIGDDETNPFSLPPSRAEEALKTLAALKQLLLAQEGWWRGARQAGGRLQRTTSLRTAAVPAAAPPGSPENGRDESLQDHSAGDTGYFEASEDYSYLVLEGSGESSTDDEVGGKERGAAGDSGIDMKKLLSSAAQPGGAPTFSRQVLTHLRLLQANLQHLKEVETKYNELYQRQVRETAETEDNRGKS